MKLYEFFGKSINPTKKLEKKRNDENIGNELFEFILDHDRLHKDYFHPTAKKLKKFHESGNEDKSAMIQEFFPMVKKGCMEFYHYKKLKGKPENIFTNEIYKDLCERLLDHYYEDVVNGIYQIGQ